MRIPILGNRSVRFQCFGKTIISYQPISFGPFKSSVILLRRPNLSIKIQQERVVFHAYYGGDQDLFTDKWGDRIADYIDSMMVLTFDFASPEPLPDPNTIERARREVKL